jgi:formylglycine-generating enzyme required for sulfatase activity
MSDKIYDVFISYRRKGGFETAKHLNDLLSHDGYSVSFDIDTLREGDFDTALLARVEQCVDFILVVDEHCFDRTIDKSVAREQDWLRIELAYALELRKNIIPILLANASFPDGLPDEIKAVSRKNGPTYSKEYFDTFYGKMKGMLHALPRYGNMRSGMPQSNCANLKVMSNLDCVMFIDGEEYGALSAGRLQKIPLPAGEYILQFKSVEHAGDNIVDDGFNMSDRDKLYKVDLLSLKQAREQKEREEKERQERECREREERERAERERREREERERLERERKEREAPREFEVNGVKFKMIYVEGGTFMMGATEEQGDDAGEREKPVHEVTLSDYYIGETVVTQALWKAVMGNKPSYYKGDDRLPVEQVSWEDAQKFVTKLNRLTGKVFRLPTEAEWEYAARGGKKSRGYKYSGSNNIDEVAWYYDNSGSKTHVVKGKKANELGLYDMSGNVCEWCNDWYGDYSSEAQDNPQGSKMGSGRVYRGGSWFGSAKGCRVSFRNYDTRSYRGYILGFRVVLAK